MISVHLESLIKELKKIDPNKTVAFGFGEPNSYRGYYEDLAFEPLPNAKIKDMLKHAEYSIGRKFTGYKGGVFAMSELTDVWIASYGSSAGDKIGETLLNYWKLD